MAKETFATLKKAFKKWDENRTKLTYRQFEGEFEAEDSEVFKSLYTTDKKDKFYKIRKDMPNNYWISNKGNMINVSTKSIYAVKAIYSGRDGNYREQYSLTINDIRYRPDPATLVALAFGCEVSEMAQNLINKHGFDAIRSIDRMPPMVQLHHISHYKHAEIENLSELRAENCRIENLKFLSAAEHDLISNAPRSKVLAEGETVTDDEINKTIAFIEKSIELNNSGEMGAIYIEQTGAKKQAGDIGCNWIEAFLQIVPNLDEKYVRYFKDIQKVEHKMSDDNYFKCLFCAAFYNRIVPQIINDTEVLKEFHELTTNGTIKLRRTAFNALLNGISQLQVVRTLDMNEE